MHNIIKLVHRIAKEAETVEDMEKLLVSELDAYGSFKASHSDNVINLYDEAKIENGYAVVGDSDGYPIALHQKMIGNVLFSRYRVRIKL